jgi:hypothetical protein
MRINDRKQFSSGLFYIVIGIGAAILSMRYTLGTPLRMGPGFFPLVVAVTMAVIGLAAIVQSTLVKPTEPGESRSIVPLLMIFCGMVSFAFLIERAGLAAAIGALLFFSCFQRLREKPLEVIGMYLVLTTVASLLSVYLFGLPISVFPG